MSLPEAEPRAPLPPGRYFMVLWHLPPQFGGMTTVSLHRAGAFRKYGGRDAAIVTFEPKPSYAGTLQLLRDQGKISPETEVLNIFQHYRAADLDGLPRRQDQPVQDLGPRGQSDVVLDPSGAVFMRSVTRPDGTTLASRTFYRADGSEFFRDEAPTDAGGRPLGRYLTLLDRQGNAVGRWRSAGSFYRHWLSELAGSDPATFIVDSAYATSIVAPLQQENIAKLMVMHNSHVAAGNDPFQGKIGEGRKTAVEQTWAWDGIVFLTRKNRQDFEDRFGKATNLFTVPNPTARAAELPEFAARARNRGVMVCRLEKQKNVAHAIEIMALVHASLPECVLDIYGTGSLRDELQAKVDELHLTDVVRFRGHAPNAARAFETARFSLLTSRNEGQGLVLMESLGRGCPPVSYDIRYGPSEIIDDGETGFLVKAGDTAAAAERIIRLCTDDGLARSMGRTGWERSVRFSDEAVIDQWGRTLDRVRQQLPERIALADLDFRLDEIGFTGSGGIDVRGELTWRQTAGPPAEDVLRAHVVIGRRSSGRPLYVPAALPRRAPGRLEVHGRVTPERLGEDVPGGNNELDLYLQVEGANVLHSFRLGFPGPAPQWRPYATLHGSLSLKFT